MKKHLYWGLGILILLLGVVGVFLLMPQNTDNESKPVLGEATKKLLKEGTEQTVVKPLPGETEAGLESVGTHPVKLEDISINWPEGADWPVNWKVLYNNLSEEEFAKLPQATKDAVNRAFYAEMGLEPPHPDTITIETKRQVSGSSPETMCLSLKYVGKNLHTINFTNSLTQNTNGITRLCGLPIIRKP